MKFLHDLLEFGVDLADTRFPLVVGTILVLCLVSIALWERIKRDRLSARHESALCQWKLNNFIGLCMRQGHVIRVLDRRSAALAVPEDRRESDTDIDSILSELQRVLIGPVSEKDWIEVAAIDHELVKQWRKMGNKDFVSARGNP